MKRFRDIIQDIKAPSTSDLWIEAGFTPEICRRLNAGEVIYMSGECWFW